MRSSNAPIPLKGIRGSQLDLFAVGVSALCLIHCVLVPVLAAALPLAAYFAESELVHRVLVLLAAPMSLWAVRKAWPVAGSRLFVATALTGLALLLSGAFVDAAAAHEEPITVAGAVLLGSAHLWRWLRYRRQCQ